MRVRHCAPSCQAAGIAVLNGVLAGTETAFTEYRLLPVVNDLGQVARWREAAAGAGRALPAMLHVDTGMHRLGLPPDEIARLAAAPEQLSGPHWRCLISHLACADEPEHPANATQLARFRAARACLPAMPASLANSAGILLGPAYHFDLVRPGIALYGGNPRPGLPNPMQPVVRLLGRVLQLRDVDAGMAVGYGGTDRAATRRRVATVAAGYADGYLRAAGAPRAVYLDAMALPVIGRVSMDLITVDVTAAPAHRVRPGTMLELIGANNPPDDLANAAGTIAYEILTGLGRRYRRHYHARTSAEARQCDRLDGRATRLAGTAER